MEKKIILLFKVMFMFSCMSAEGCDDGGDNKGDAGADADTDADTDSDTDSDTDADTDTDTDSDTDIDTDADTDADTETETDSDSDTEVCPEVDCSAPRVRYVNQAVDLSGDGLTWETAFKSVQEGVHSAWCAVQECGQIYQVWVARGTYWIFRNNVEDTLALTTMIELYGGFIGNESILEERDWVNNSTILSGLSGGEDDYRAVRHVVTAEDLTRLDGFTITEGDANCGELTWSCMVGQGEEMEACARGGGVFKQPGSMVVANCNFLENRAWHQDEVWKEYEEPEQLVLCSRDDCGSGGAIYDAGGSLTVENCLFQNTYSVRGGAIYSMGYLQISDSVFETNTAFGQWNQYDPCDKEPRADWRQDAYDHTEFGYGGAICNSGSLEIRRCSFHGNVSVNGGVLKAGKIDVRDSEFVDNRAYGVYKEYDTITDEYGNGGAVEQNDLDGQLAAANCVFSQNTAKTGGAISACNAAVFNSVFYQNSAVSELDPLPDDVEPGSCSAIFLAGDPATVYVKNSIFQEGIADDDKVVSDNVDVSYSRIDTDYEGEGNVDADALFTDPQNGDFHLQTGSPCIDSADGTAAPELDKDGNPRYDAPLTPNTGIGPPWADMGAYEWFE